MNIFRIRAIIQKFWFSNMRDIFRLFDMFFWPVIELFTWGIFSVFLSKSSVGGVNLVTLLLGGIVLWSFFNRASKDISLSMIDELWSRNFINLFSTPLTMGEYVIGAVIIGFVKLLISMVLLFFLAYAFYAFNVSSMGFYIIPSAAGITLFGWALSIVVQASFLRYGHTVEVFIWAIASLVQPFSCIFYPLSALPHWAQYVARILPTTYFFENMRRVMMGQNMDRIQLVIAFSLNFIYLFLALMYLKLSYRKARENGNLVKNL